MYGPSIGRKLTRAGNGPLNHGLLTGIKKITVHYGLESPWACNGPKDTKASYGPKDVMGHRWAESEMGWCYIRRPT